MSDVQPLPAPPLEDWFEYIVAATVAAPDAEAAIEAAVQTLQPDQTMIGVHETRRVTGVLWRVSLKVAEDA